MRTLYYLVVFFILTSFNVKDIQKFKTLDIYYIDNSSVSGYQGISLEAKGAIQEEMLKLKPEDAKFLMYVSNSLTPVVCKRFSDIESTYKPIYVNSYSPPNLDLDITQLKTELLKTEFSVSNKISFNCFVTDYFVKSNFGKNMSSLILKNFINQLEQMNTADNCKYELNFYYNDNENKVSKDDLESTFKFYQKNNITIKIEKLTK